MKKFCLGLLLSSLCLIGSTLETFASENTGQTTISVTFERALSPESPLPGGTVTNDKKVSIPSRTYPKTNEEEGTMYIIIGMALMGVAGVILIEKKREEEQTHVSTSD